MLFKSEGKWTPSQRHRAEILFSRYSRIKKGYQSSRRLNRIYQHTKEKGFVFTKLTQWYNEVDQENLKYFNTIRRSIEQHYQNILNYYY